MRGVGEPDQIESVSAVNHVPAQRLLEWAESLSAIARTGLGFTESLYEVERFEEILRTAAEMKAAAVGDVDTEDLVAEWMASVRPGTRGYVTPKVAVAAVVGDDQGRMLLIKRSDRGVWLYPTGWADVGYSASEVVVKEVFEETGIRCEPVRLIALIDGTRHGFTRIPMYSLVFHCRLLGGDLRPHPLEVTDVGWFARGDLPRPFALEDVWVDQAFAAIAGEDVPVRFDPPRRVPWG